jgi:signal peptidase I
VQASSKIRTESSDLDLTTLDFLRLAAYHFSQQSDLRVKMTGRSMSPAIEEDEWISIEPVVCDQISPGDVVLYASLSDTAVIHRVVRIDRGTETRIVTRGDSCLIDDVPVPIDRVLGKVIQVNPDGSVVAVNKSRPTLWRRILIKLGIRSEKGPDL